MNVLPLETIPIFRIIGSNNMAVARTCNILATLNVSIGLWNCDFWKVCNFC